MEARDRPRPPGARAASRLRCGEPDLCRDGEGPVDTSLNEWPFALVLVMLAVDLFAVGGGKQHRVSVKEPAIWSGIWVGVSLLFAGVLCWHLDDVAGREVANTKSLEFVTGYLIEKSLAVVAVIIGVSVWLSLRQGRQVGVRASGRCPAVEASQGMITCDVPGGQEVDSTLVTRRRRSRIYRAWSSVSPSSGRPSGDGRSRSGRHR